MLRIPALELNSNRLVVTTAGTPEVIPSPHQVREIMIVAGIKNTGLIVIGGPNVVADIDTMIGAPLYSGDVFVVDVDELDIIYVDAEVSGDCITYVYIW